MRLSWIHKYVLDMWEKRCRKYLERSAEKKLRAHTDLWSDLCDYQKRTISSGASYSDYWLLYSYIRSVQPKEVLECGTGVTTLILAYAMRDNEKNNGVRGRITSMESVTECYESARKLMPEHLRPYVDIVFSPKVEDAYYFFRGVRYESVPERSYEFVYIDGPGTSAPSDGHKTFNCDLIKVVERSAIPVVALIDTRMSTCFVFGLVFKRGKVAYDYRYDVGFVGPVTANDLLSANGVIKAIGPHPLRRGNVKRLLHSRRA